MESYDVSLKLINYDLILQPHVFLDVTPIQHLLEYDAKFKNFKALPMFFPEIMQFLTSEYAVKIDFTYGEKLSFETVSKYSLRPYQEDALRKWIENNYKGIICLPTGTGKTFLGLDAIHNTKSRTLVIVPTISLLYQWRSAIVEHIGVSKENIGIWGGGKQELGDITITTYDSAHIYVKRFQNSFDLLIFDEVHHLPAPTYRAIAEGTIASKRLGLSATPERSDELHHDLEILVGKVVFRLEHKELVENGYVAPFELKTITIELSEDEQRRYNDLDKIYKDYVKKYHVFDFEKLVLRSGRDKKARKALLARQEARKISFGSGRKLDVLEELLIQHQHGRVIIFCEFNEIVHEIAKRFLIPEITHKTKFEERKIYLESFKNGQYSKLVTGRVLDEGWDVDANIGIIVSGSGSKRQFIQRLGRILRPSNTHSKAILYELVTKETLEVSTASRRK
ncbi:DEAD/DEAH box helicase [Candidatus Borrarchaeum sp.]|uniref:DEAD/DEAH box helicase n=1 Tax=Candidatus Borrarchaeum sp. TaxID=2846742 RepID=UPI00257B73F9|nr:DEAD/DEAH box helicase [Candidatus Borrarchaeum sp.]